MDTTAERLHEALFGGAPEAGALIVECDRGLGAVAQSQGHKISSHRLGLGGLTTLKQNSEEQRDG